MENELIEWAGFDNLDSINNEETQSKSSTR